MDFGKRSCDKFVILVGFSPHPAFCQGEGVPYFNSVDGCHPSGNGIQKSINNRQYRPTPPRRWRNCSPSAKYAAGLSVCLKHWFPSSPCLCQVVRADLTSHPCPVSLSNRVCPPSAAARKWAPSSMRRVAARSICRQGVQSMDTRWHRHR